MIQLLTANCDCGRCCVGGDEADAAAEGVVLEQNTRGFSGLRNNQAVITLGAGSLGSVAAALGSLKAASFTRTDTDTKKLKLEDLTIKAYVTLLSL